MRSLEGQPSPTVPIWKPEGFHLEPLALASSLLDSDPPHAPLPQHLFVRKFHTPPLLHLISDLPVLLASG